MILLKCPVLLEIQIPIPAPISSESIFVSTRPNITRPGYFTLHFLHPLHPLHLPFGDTESASANWFMKIPRRSSTRFRSVLGLLGGDLGEWIRELRDTKADTLGETLQEARQEVSPCASLNMRR